MRVINNEYHTKRGSVLSYIPMAYMLDIVDSINTTPYNNHYVN
jgi:hypothetical protein